MSRFQYGDLLRYPPEQDEGGLYRFMFIRLGNRELTSRSVYSASIGYPVE